MKNDFRIKKMKGEFVNPKSKRLDEKGKLIEKGLIHQVIDLIEGLLTNHSP